MRNQFITNNKLHLSVLCLLIKPLEKAIARCSHFQTSPDPVLDSGKTAILNFGANLHTVFSQI